MKKHIYIAKLILIAILASAICFTMLYFSNVMPIFDWAGCLGGSIIVGICGVINGFAD